MRSGLQAFGLQVLPKFISPRLSVSVPVSLEALWGEGVSLICLCPSMAANVMVIPWPITSFEGCPSSGSSDRKNQNSLSHAARLINRSFKHCHLTVNVTVQLKQVGVLCSDVFSFPHPED